MQRMKTSACLGFAAGIVALIAASSASAAPSATGADASAGRGRFFRAADADRAIDARRGPFFGLRVHSMDVAGPAKNVACFEYVIDGLRPGVQPETYDLVRTVYDVQVAPSACDEVMGLPLPPNADVRAWHGVMGQTRWMRRNGPSSTPVGGFVGRLVIEAVVGGDGSSDGGRRIGVFDFQLAGTTGLRPMRGDPDDASARSDEARCGAPRHDEGWYVGRVQRKALLAFAREFGDVDGVPRMLRTIDRSVLAGTFEGHLAIAPDADARIDSCNIEKGAWWFDGLLAWDAKRARVTDRTTPEPVAADAAGAK